MRHQRFTLSEVLRCKVMDKFSLALSRCERALKALTVTNASFFLMPYAEPLVLAVSKLG